MWLILLLLAACTVTVTAQPQPNLEVMEWRVNDTADRVRSMESKLYVMSDNLKDVQNSTREANARGEKVEEYIDYIFMGAAGMVFLQIWSLVQNHNNAKRRMS